MLVEFRQLLPQYSVLQPQKMELTRNLRHVASKIAKFQNRSAPRLQRWHRRGRNVKTFPVSASSSKSLQGFVAAWISWISSGRNFGRHSNPTCSQSAVQWGVQVDAQPTFSNGTQKQSFCFTLGGSNLVTSQSTAEAPSCFFQKRVFLACHPDITSLPSTILSVENPPPCALRHPSLLVASHVQEVHQPLIRIFREVFHYKKTEKNTTNFLTRFFFSNKFDQ